MGSPESQINQNGRDQITGLGHEMDEGVANPMTRATWNRLIAQLPIVEEQVATANKSKGEAAGQNADWHDNPAYDQALLDARLTETLLNSLKAKLAKVIIIEPRQETDTVGLGNEIVLRFEEEDEDESFVLLGPDDAITGIEKEPRWISLETPIGKAIFGKAAGSTVNVHSPNGEIKVKIKKIKPGNF